MSWIEALILGLIQGLTEFLPVSSSGHLEIGKALLGVEAEKSLIFTIVVHGATVLSTIVVFRNDILQLLKGLFAFRWNEETQYIALIILSMLPVGIAGLWFKDQIEGLFSGNMILVGSMLLITALLLLFTRFFRARERKISAADALLIGIAQAVAVIPGISRSGATIATGLMLGKKREEVTRFSFLMVLIPIIGQNMLSLLTGEMDSGGASVSAAALVAGFIAAFVAGLLACKWMISIVKRGNLVWFAVYCFIAGLIAIGAGIL
ncbi:MAG: undecaprenyl-diphosphate phosphatase [Bacteroidales bacterium]